MIVKEGGHWRSVRTLNENKRVLKEELSELSAEEKQCVMKIIEEYGSDGQSSLADMIAEDHWETVPEPIEKWINSTDLVGDIAHSIFPQHKLDICEFFNGGYHEYILTGGIGVGKTFTATVCLMRVLYELLCLKNPQKSLGLAPGSPIYIAPISKTKELARRVVFGQIAGKLNLSPFFRGRFIETKEEIRFPKKGIYIIGGTSTNAGILGMDVIAGIVDEGNFYGRGKMITAADDTAYDKAEVIYNGLVRRIKSRFSKHGVKGFVFLVSSKRGSDDFTERRLQELAEEENTETGVFVRDYSAWGVAPERYADSQWFDMAYSTETGRSRILKKGEKSSEGEQVVGFPDEFLIDFERDPIGALRDKAGISVEVASPFITNRSFLDEMTTQSLPRMFGSEFWVTDQDLDILWDDFLLRPRKSDPVAVCCPGSIRHAALDMSLKHDATGLCIAHSAGLVEVVKRDPRTGREVIEEATLVHIDGMLQIRPPAVGEIEHERIRGLLYLLMNGGLPIRTVSMDQYCRGPNAQLLRRHGLRVVDLSVDRTMEPYLGMRAALYERRIKAIKHKLLYDEMRRLAITPDGRKVDHPVRGSKDLCDAMTSCVYYLCKHAPSNKSYIPQKGISEAGRSGLSYSDGNFLWGDEGGSSDDYGDLPCYIVR